MYFPDLVYGFFRDYQMARYYDGNGVQAYCMGHGAYSCPVLAEFCKIAVTDQTDALGRLVLCMTQVPKLSPYLFLEFSAEKEKVIPGSLLFQLPYFFKTDGCGCDVAVYLGGFVLGFTASCALCECSRD